METTLVTGFPAYTAKRMIAKILADGERAQVAMLVRHQDAALAREFSGALNGDLRRRILVLHGNVADMDLGLSAQQYRLLLKDVTMVHHMAARHHLGASSEEVEQFNVGGTRGVLELALECEKLQRFCLWSTVFVSGDREGVVMEDELDRGQAFRNVYESSKFEAEKIARSLSRRVPTTIFRPGIIVGDSATGEINRYDGPYHLMSVLMHSPFDLQLPLPGKGEGPFHLVPIDYVVAAAHALSRSTEAEARTFHLVDPCPLSGRSVYELVAGRAQRRIPRRVIPQGVAMTMLKLPWVGKLRGSPRTIMEGFNQQVTYNCRNTLELLRRSDIWCPPFEQYVDNLVRYVKDLQAARGRKDDEISDPLA